MLSLRRFLRVLPFRGGSTRDQQVSSPGNQSANFKISILTSETWQGLRIFAQSYEEITDSYGTRTFRARLMDAPPELVDKLKRECRNADIDFFIQDGRTVELHVG